MKYLAQSRLRSSADPETREEAVAFIEQCIFPTGEFAKELPAGKKILAGGPVHRTAAPAFMVNAGSTEEFDQLATSLPAWPLMEGKLTPLSTFEVRQQTLLPRREQRRTQARKIEAAALEGGL